MPTSLRLVLAVLLVVVGAALLIVAVLGTRERLPRNRVAGVRTRASMHSGPAFAIANRVAAPLLAAAGVVGLAGGGALFATTAAVLAWVLVIVSALGVVVLAGLGGSLGDRAASTLVAALPAAESCGGACAGCDLVAGCRPSATNTP